MHFNEGSAHQPDIPKETYHNPIPPQDTYQQHKSYGDNE